MSYREPVCVSDYEVFMTAARLTLAVMVLHWLLNTFQPASRRLCLCSLSGFALTSTLSKIFWLQKCYLQMEDTIKAASKLWNGIWIGGTEVMAGFWSVMSKSVLHNRRNVWVYKPPFFDLPFKNQAEGGKVKVTLKYSALYTKIWMYENMITSSIHYLCSVVFILFLKLTSFLPQVLCFESSVMTKMLTGLQSALCG